MGIKFHIRKHFCKDVPFNLKIDMDELNNVALNNHDKVIALSGIPPKVKNSE